VHPTPVERMETAQQGWGRISTVGSATYAELTTRRITGASGRDVSTALHARAHLQHGGLQVGAIRASPSAGGALGLPCMPEGHPNGQHARGGRLHYALFVHLQRRAARGIVRLPHGNPRLLPYPLSTLQIVRMHFSSCEMDLR
jgi:hypothetical protein